MRVRRVAPRQISVYLALLALALISGPPERAAAQEPAQRWDGLFELVSARYDYPPPWPAAPHAAEAASRTSRHAISDDGRYVIFTSDTTNWGYSAPGIYRRDRRTGQTELLLGYPAAQASISGDG